MKYRLDVAKCPSEPPLHLQSTLLLRVRRTLFVTSLRRIVQRLPSPTAVPAVAVSFPLPRYMTAAAAGRQNFDSWSKSPVFNIQNLPELDSIGGAIPAFVCGISNVRKILGERFARFRQTGRRRVASLGLFQARNFLVWALLCIPMPCLAI